jgi:hypothetical protein
MVSVDPEKRHTNKATPGKRFEEVRDMFFALSPLFASHGQHLNEPVISEKRLAVGDQHADVCDRFDPGRKPNGANDYTCNFDFHGSRYSVSLALRRGRGRMHQ